MSSIINLVGLSLLLWPKASAYRCRVDFGDKAEGYYYRVSAVQQFVANADVIVRATAIDTTRPSPKAREDPQWFPNVSFRVDEVIRGSKDLRSVELRGRFVDHDRFNTRTVPYQIMAGGDRGTCQLADYRRGGRYLLLLSADSTGLHLPFWAPLGPVNEQLRGLTDAWLLWIRAQARTRRSP